MITEAIAKYMEEKGIKEETLCEKAGIAKNCIGLALKGEKNLSIEEYQQICFALHLPLEYFFNHDGKIA